MISSAWKMRSGCGIPGARLGAGNGELGPEAVEVDRARQPRLRRHRPLSHEVVEVVAASEPSALEHGLVAHRGENRREPLPRDVLVAALDPRDRTLAGAGAIGELSLAQRVLHAQLLDQFGWSHDAVYGIREIRAHTALGRPGRGSAPSCDSVLGGAPSDCRG